MSGWTTLYGRPQVVRYGDGEVVPKANGAENGGDYFFMGDRVPWGQGQAANSALFQVVDLQGIVDWSTGENYSFTLSAWQGGWATQKDRAEISVSFLDANNNVLHTFQLHSVTNDDRGNQTIMVYTELIDAVSFGATQARVDINFLFFDGSWENDSYVDNIRLSVYPVPIPEPAVYGALLAGLAGAFAFARRSRR